MKIAMIAPEAIPVPPLTGGSVEKCMIRIAGSLQKNHNVTIISRAHQAYPPRSQEGNLTILRVPAGGADPYIRHVLAQIDGERFDLIQVDNRPAFLPKVKAAFPSTPVALFLHSTTFVSPPKAAVAQVAAQLKSAELIVANSRALQRRLAELFPAHWQKLRHVYLGVNPGQFRAPAAAERTGARRWVRGERSYNVVYAGRIIPRKGIPVLIRAVALARRQVPHIRLIVAGGIGPKKYMLAMKRLARSAGIRSTFLGNVASKSMHRVYWAGDCFVCPSQKLEAFGLVNVEAMACGLPVIASSNGGIREIIRHGKSGLLVGNYGDPRAFSREIVRLARTPGLARSLAAQGKRETALRFNWEQTADHLERIYRRGIRRACIFLSVLHRKN